MNVYFVSLGCDKNLVDSEEMLGLLNESGYSFVDDPVLADIIIVNTCAFINDAKEESVNTILELAMYKNEGKCKALIVAGCLAERYKAEMAKLIPEIDAILGTNSYTDILNAVKCGLERSSDEEKCYQLYNDFSTINRSNGNQIVTTGGYYAYLKIAEGCNKRCSYCIIPSIRGNYRSIPTEDLIKRATLLASKGVKELILVAQETTLYGIDIYGEKRLPKLLKELAKVEGIEWIRLLYSYPEEITDELINTIKTEPKVCHYIDMPIQHASDNILKKMGRKTSNADLVNIVNKLKMEIPDMIIRTTLIVGFPGETSEDFSKLCDFVSEMKFERLGAFTYSKEEDTKAFDFDNQVDESVKEERFSEIMAKQQEISAEFLKGQIGKTLKVMVEGKLVEDDAYIGRSYMDAPSVDGNVFFTYDGELMSGDFVNVKITGSSEYDLIGEIEQ